eukprot:UN01074
MNRFDPAPVSRINHLRNGALLNRNLDRQPFLTPQKKRTFDMRGIDDAFTQPSQEV